ncbi:MAG: threonine/serine exporter family protein, partial [Atopobiaceae bacterium]
MAQSHHMPMSWRKRATDEDMPVTQAPVDDKATLVCRVGALLLSAGTGAWRVRDSMNRVSRALGVTCSADLGLVSIECTCAEGAESATEVHSLPSSGVNTDRIMLMDGAVGRMEAEASGMTLGQAHALLDSIERTPGRYASYQAGLASAAACAAFVFLLGGGPIEMACAFVGAGLGNWLRRAMLDRHLNQFLGICCSVALACISYLLSLTLLAQAIPGAMSHEAGYIGAMLFVIPGFPLITSGLDLMKLDMRSGIERLVYALAVIFVATFVAMLVAMGVNLAPDDFVSLGLSEPVMVLLRLAMSFVGVFGFSMMFNSPLD